MSGIDRLMDLTSGDLQDAPRGAFVTGDPLRNKIIFSYAVARGTFEGDPEMGQRFGELARAVNSVATQNRLRDLVVDAVQWLLDSGELASVDVTVEKYDAETLAFAAVHYPADGGKAIEIGPFFVSVGG